eukprot:2758887-Pyramimonas_sp.AAC.1
MWPPIQALASRGELDPVRAPRPQGLRGRHHQEVAKRPGSPIALPNDGLRAFCGFHEMFLEHFWR